MLLFLHGIVVVLVIFGSRPGFFSSYIIGRKTAIKSNFKFMAARIKWIFIRKMILKQDTHCKCAIASAAAAAVASCCMLFLAYVERANQFSTNLLCFVCNFSRLFVFRFLFYIFIFGESHTCIQYT